MDRLRDLSFSLESLVQTGNDIGNVFNANTKVHNLLGNTCRGLFLNGYLAMSGGCRVAYQGFCITLPVRPSLFRGHPQPDS